MLSSEHLFWPLHIFDVKTIENEPFTNTIPDKDINDIEELRISPHATHQELSHYIGSVFFCALKILREDMRIKEEKHQNYPISDAISDEDINHI